MNEEILLLKIEKYEKLRKDSHTAKANIDKQISELEAEISRFKFQEDEDALKELLQSNVFTLPKNGHKSVNLNVQTSFKNAADLNSTLQGITNYVVNPSRLNDFMMSVEKDRLLFAKLNGNQFLGPALTDKSIVVERNSVIAFKQTGKIYLNSDNKLTSATKPSEKTPSRIELTSNVSFKSDKTDEELVDFQITKVPIVPSVQNIFKDEINRELDFRTDRLKMTYTRNSLDIPGVDDYEIELGKQTVVFPALQKSGMNQNDDLYSFSDDSLKFDNKPLSKDLKDMIKNNSSNTNSPIVNIHTETGNNDKSVERSLSKPYSELEIGESISQFCLENNGYNYTNATSFKNMFSDPKSESRSNKQKKTAFPLSYDRKAPHSTAGKVKSDQSTKSRSNVKISYKTINKENSNTMSHKTEGIHDIFDLSLKKSEFVVKDKSYVAFYEKNKQVMNKFDQFFKKIETGKSKKSDEKPMKESIFDEEIMVSVDSKTIEDIMTINSPMRNERLSSLRYTLFN